MITAVQQLNERGGPAAELVFPTARSVAGARGAVALLEGGELALYVLRLNGRWRAFVFRTVHEPLIEHTLLPGVAPGVQLLIELRTQRRVRRVRQLLATLQQERLDPRALSNNFYVRVGVALNGKMDVAPSALIQAFAARERLTGASGA